MGGTSAPTIKHLIGWDTLCETADGLGNPLTADRSPGTVNAGETGFGRPGLALSQEPTFEMNEPYGRGVIPPGAPRALASR